jgi:hypothetical protein
VLEGVSARWRKPKRRGGARDFSRSLDSFSTSAFPILLELSSQPAVMSSSASPSNPPSASQLSKASKNLEKVRRKAYDVFTRVNGASSPEELIGSDAREGEEGSCWIWLVNLGESGGDLEGKRTTLRETIRGDGWTWVPLLGMVRRSDSDTYYPCKKSEGRCFFF